MNDEAVCVITVAHLCLREVPQLFNLAQPGSCLTMYCEQFCAPLYNAASDDGGNDAAVCGFDRAPCLAFRFRRPFFRISFRSFDPSLPPFVFPIATQS